MTSAPLSQPSDLGHRHGPGLGEPAQPPGLGFEAGPARIPVRASRQRSWRTRPGRRPASHGSAARRTARRRDGTRAPRCRAAARSGSWRHVQAIPVSPGRAARSGEQPGELGRQGPGPRAAPGRRPARSLRARRRRDRGPPGPPRRLAGSKLRNSAVRPASRSGAIFRSRARLLRSMAVTRSYRREPGPGRTAAPGAPLRRSRAGTAPPWPARSMGAPRCQSPVPALSTSTCPDRPARSSSSRSITSAIGDRQMLPRHTRQTRYGPDALLGAGTRTGASSRADMGTSMPDAVSWGDACHDGRHGRGGQIPETVVLARHGARLARARRPAARGSRRRRGDRRCRVYRPVDRVLPVPRRARA